MFKVKGIAMAIFTLALLSPGLALAEKPSKPNPNSVLNKIVPVDQKFAGKTYSELTEAWFQWIAFQPDYPNSMTDRDGSQASEGQGGKFWFLAGTDGGEAERDIKVPAGKAIFFPLINVWWFTNKPPGVPSYCWTTLDIYMKGTTDLTCTIDGVPVKNLDSFFARSRGYPDSWSGDFIFYAQPPDPAPVYPAMLEGYWILLQPLSAGKHTIEFGGRTIVHEPEWEIDVDFSTFVTCHITVGP